MRVQTEAKFLKVDVDEIRKRLTMIKAVIIEPMNLFELAIVSQKHAEKISSNSWIKLRTNPKHTTLSYKEKVDNQPGGILRTDIVIDSFDAALELLEKLGMFLKSFQESRREMWRVGDVEVSLNEWPWLTPYMKIVASEESAVRDVCARLGFEWSQAIFGDTTLAYVAEYPGIRLELGENIAHMPEVKFGMALPQWLKDRTVA